MTKCSSIQRVAFLMDSASEGHKNGHRLEKKKEEEKKNVNMPVLQARPCVRQLQDSQRWLQDEQNSEP